MTWITTNWTTTLWQCSWLIFVYYFLVLCIKWQARQDKKKREHQPPL